MDQGSLSASQKQIVIPLRNAAESSSSSSGSHKWADVRSMSGKNKRVELETVCGAVIAQVTFVHNICLIA